MPFLCNIKHKMSSIFKPPVHNASILKKMALEYFFNLSMETQYVIPVYGSLCDPALFPYSVKDFSLAVLFFVSRIYALCCTSCLSASDILLLFSLPRISLISKLHDFGMEESKLAAITFLLHHFHSLVGPTHAHAVLTFVANDSFLQAACSRHQFLLTLQSQRTLENVLRQWKNIVNQKKDIRLRISTFVQTWRHRRTLLCLVLTRWKTLLSCKQKFRKRCVQNALKKWCQFIEHKKRQRLREIRKEREVKKKQCARLRQVNLTAFCVRLKKIFIIQRIRRILAHWIHWTRFRNKQRIIVHLVREHWEDVIIPRARMANMQFDRCFLTLCTRILIACLLHFYHISPTESYKTTSQQFITLLERLVKSKSIAEFLPLTTQVEEHIIFRLTDQLLRKNVAMKRYKSALIFFDDFKQVLSRLHTSLLKIPNYVDVSIQEELYGCILGVHPKLDTTLHLMWKRNFQKKVCYQKLTPSTILQIVLTWLKEVSSRPNSCVDIVQLIESYMPQVLAQPFKITMTIKSPHIDQIVKILQRSPDQEKKQIKKTKRISSKVHYDEVD